MTTIWKFKLRLKEEQTIDMPGSPSFLHVAMQNDELCLWAIVQPDQPIARRTILIIGTGHPAENVGLYIGTVLMSGGAFVWHVFEKRQE
jgi:hypothetical protein